MAVRRDDARYQRKMIRSDIERALERQNTLPLTEETERLQTALLEAKAAIIAVQREHREA